MAGLPQGAARLSAAPGDGPPPALRPLVLASGSPRRRDLLGAAGWVFDVRPVDADESVLPGEDALTLCLRLSCLKAAVAAERFGGGADAPACVLGGDTVVAVDGRPLGKPADREEAAAMLRELSGREHEVASGVALRHLPTGREAAELAVSRVRFDALDETTLETYLAGGEWDGKAGAYAIQGRAAAFAHLVHGDLDTVVGLPVRLVERLARQLAQDVADAGAAP